MVRTVNEAAYEARRNAILDAAKLVIETKGYEQMAIADLLSGLERSLRRLSRCRGETELFRQGQHIVVVVDTHDLPIPDLKDKTAPQFARAPHAWKNSRWQMQ